MTNSTNTTNPIKAFATNLNGEKTMTTFKTEEAFLKTLGHESVEAFEKPMSNHETNKMFKFKANETVDASSIVIEGIEHKSSGFIAGRLVAVLEKKGHLIQSLAYDEMGNPAKNYHFNSHLQHEAIAMLAVELAGILPLIDVEMEISTIANSTFVWKNFYRIARANSKIVAYPGDMNKAYWVVKATKALELGVEAKLLTRTDKGVIRSDRYLSTCVSRSGIAHQTNPITDDNRRKERVKMNFNPKKDGTSREVRQALTFIESNAQCVNTTLLDVLNQVVAYYTDNQLLLPEVLKTSKHVIDGCNFLRCANALHSEYFMDLRGRMYQFCHYGPNPQSSDMAKALCYHTVQEEVLVDTPAFEIFKTEMFDEVIGGNDYWAREDVIRRVAGNTAGALQHALSANGGIPFKKFFTYMDMCHTWVAFLDHGKATTQLGFGPDGKASGAQILSILAGSRTLAKACGLTADVVRTADPYVMSCAAIERLQVKSTVMSIRQALQLTRNDVKTPFMAIQYGGGVPALRYKAFEPIMGRVGVNECDREAFCKDYVIEGVKEALGAKVGSLIEGLREAAKEVQTITGKDYFNYRHIDGFLCTKKGDAKVMMTEAPFMINFGETGKQAVIFGSLETEQKVAQGWMIDSHTIGELQAQNFMHYFPVHFVQGLDAVMARKIALECEKQGLRGYSTIHDQFRVCLSDAPKMKVVIANVYKDMFIDNNPLMHLQAEMSRAAKCDIQINVGNPLHAITQVVTEEILYSENSYYFE